MRIRAECYIDDYVYTWIILKREPYFVMSILASCMIATRATIDWLAVDLVDTHSLRTNPKLKNIKGNMVIL